MLTVGDRSPAVSVYTPELTYVSGHPALFCGTLVERSQTVAPPSCAWPLPLPLGPSLFCLAPPSSAQPLPLPLGPTIAGFQHTVYPSPVLSSLFDTFDSPLAHLVCLYRTGEQFETRDLSCPAWQRRCFVMSLSKWLHDLKQATRH